MRYHSGKHLDRAPKMRRVKHEDRELEDEDTDRRTRGLAGVAIILFLAVVASYLIQSLRKEGEIEDCLLAQRLNCDSLVDAR
jgi:hypothetical protein